MDRLTAPATGIRLGTKPNKYRSLWSRNGTPNSDVAPTHEWHGPCHHTEYGFPLEDDVALFERLVLEINQAGLSWLTILKKREAFRRAYGGFDPEIVARYGARDRRRLLADPGIIRNRLKVEAAIANASRIASCARVTAPSRDGWQHITRAPRKCG